MSKISLTLLSLLAAIPAGVLVAQMVMAFMNYGGGANLSFVVLAGMTLLTGGILAVLPVGVLIFAPSAGASARPKKNQPAPDEETSIGDDDLQEVDEVEEVDDAFEDDAEMEATDDEDLLADDDLLVDDGEEEAVEDWDDAEFDDAEFDDDDFEDDDK